MNALASRPHNGYHQTVAAHSAIGIETPATQGASRDPAAFLFAQHRPFSMAGCVGHSHEWPVTLYAGSLNPAHLAAHIPLRRDQAASIPNTRKPIQ